MTHQRPSGTRGRLSRLHCSTNHPFNIFRDRDDASLLLSYQRPGFLFDLLAAAISGICAASHRQ
jgi:hypothetical protein